MIALRRVTDIHPAVCDCHPLGDGYIVELSCFHTYHTRFEREVDQMTTCRQCEADAIQESPDCMPAGSSPSGGPGSSFMGSPAPTTHGCGGVVGDTLTGATGKREIRATDLTRAEQPDRVAEWECVSRGESPDGTAAKTQQRLAHTGFESRTQPPSCHVCSQPIVLLPGMVDPYLGPRRFGKPTCGECALAIDLAENEAWEGVLMSSPLPQLSEKARAKFATAVPGFWAKCAEIRDAKLSPTYRPPAPHEACQGRKVRALLFGHHECPDCAAKRLRRMDRAELPSFMRDTVTRLMAQYDVCRNCYRRREHCVCVAFVEGIER